MQTSGYQKVMSYATQKNMVYKIPQGVQGFPSWLMAIKDACLFLLYLV